MTIRRVARVLSREYASPSGGKVLDMANFSHWFGLTMSYGGRDEISSCRLRLSSLATSTVFLLRIEVASRDSYAPRYNSVY